MSPFELSPHNHSNIPSQGSFYFSSNKKFITSFQITNHSVTNYARFWTYGIDYADYQRLE